MNDQQSWRTSPQLQATRLMTQPPEILGRTVSTFTIDDFTDFVGAFTGEARMLTVNAEGLVFESANNVTDKGTERVADVTYQLSEPRSENGVATAQAVVTAVKIYDRKAFHDRVPRVGDTGTFRIEGGVVRSPFVKRQYCEGKAAKKGVCG